MPSSTPLPWHARAGTVRDADGVIVCETSADDAARIVAAMNAQEALEADNARLRGALEFKMDTDHPPTTYEAAMARYEGACRALNLALAELSAALEEADDAK